MNIILGSGSPRRKELLELAGYDFTIEVSEADEDISTASPSDMVEQLSCRKAAAVAANYTGRNPDQREKDADNQERSTGSQDPDLQSDGRRLIIGADTVVALEGDILGKPDNEEDASHMLRELSGRTHQVYTGVSLLLLDGNRILESRTFSECTDVTMRNLSDEEIQAYIKTGEPMDKAGAYGIQGKAAIFISGIRGDYYNVVGLPICHLVEEIKAISE